MKAGALAKSGTLTRFGILGFRLLGGVNHRLLAFDERPLEGLFRAVNVDAFSILARRIEERPADPRGQICTLEFEVRALDREGRAVFRDELVANFAAAEAAHVLRGGARQARGHRADAMGGIPHGRQSGPIVGPAIHVLLVTGLEKLELAELALVEELFHKEVLAAIDHGLHHHVLEAGLFDQIDDLLAILDGGGHGHGAGHVLAGFESGDGLGGVIGDRRIDVDGMHLGILEQVAKLRVAPGHPGRHLRSAIQLLGRALADRVHIRVGMPLINGNEFGTEAEADDGDIDFLLVGHEEQGKVKSERAQPGVKRAP